MEDEEEKEDLRFFAEAEEEATGHQNSGAYLKYQQMLMESFTMSGHMAGSAAKPPFSKPSSIQRLVDIPSVETNASSSGRLTGVVQSSR